MIILHLYYVFFFFFFFFFFFLGGGGGGGLFGSYKRLLSFYNVTRSTKPTFVLQEWEELCVCVREREIESEIEIDGER